MRGKSSKRDKIILILCLTYFVSLAAYSLYKMDQNKEFDAKLYKIARTHMMRCYNDPEVESVKFVGDSASPGFGTVYIIKCHTNVKVKELTLEDYATVFIDVDNFE